MAVKCHTDRNLPSPRSAPVDYVGVILDAVRKFEKVPDRREMIHDAMYTHMLSQYRTHVATSPDALVPALIEWLILARWVGPRKSEWCSDSPTKYKVIDDEYWDGPDALPFIFEDFVFLTASGQEIKITKDMWSDPQTSMPSTFAYLVLRVRKQKNNDNYQKLTYARIYKNPLLCPVRAAFRIVCRGRRLRLPKTHPAAVHFSSTHKSFRLITANDTNVYLRRVAQAVYKLPAGSNALRLWSTHSLRVTACNLLHRAGFSDSAIKNRLRWRSDSFMMYLRNTFYTADAHASALDLGIQPTQHEKRTLEEHELIQQGRCALAA
eukprot:scaffold18357_cov62-Cyclotella_meneghiniana.AAC.1